MKNLIVVALFIFLAGCDRAAPVDDMARLENEKLKIRQEIENLKNQNKAIQEGIGMINKKIKTLNNK